MSPSRSTARWRRSNAREHQQRRPRRQPDARSGAAPHPVRDRRLHAPHRGQLAPQARVDGEWTDKPNYFDITVWGARRELRAVPRQGPPGGRPGEADWREWDAQDGRSDRRSRSSPTTSSSSAAATETARAAASSSCLGRSAGLVRRLPPRPRPTTTSRSRRRADGTAENPADAQASGLLDSAPGGRRKSCLFCKDKVEEVDYKNLNQLRRYISEKGKIRNRRITGACRRHQRQVAVAVKRAREMALLPYVEPR